MKQLKKIELLPEKTETRPETALTVANEPEEPESPAFPKIARLIEKIHFKPFPWKSLNAKNALIAGCLVVVAVAGYLNIRYGLTSPKEEVPSGEETPAVRSEDAENYFAAALIDRERVRDEALEVLVGITEDESADETARKEAFNEMERIANETTSEINIENLVKAKGFRECVAVLNGDAANVVVKSEGLTAGEVAQIKEIVYLEAEILPKNIKIIERNN